MQILTSFIPGRLILKPGTRADYRQLERFHYLAGPPATFAQIWTIHHQSCTHLRSDLRQSSSLCVLCGNSALSFTPIAIAVLSHPCLNSHARDRALNLSRLPPKARMKFVNQNIRTLSRLIVHPAYRGLGLASILIQCILHNSPTRYTESLSTIAKAHPLFQKSAMREFPPADDKKPSYFLFESNRRSKIANRKFTSPPSKNSYTAAGHK